MRKSTNQEVFDVLMLRNGATETTATAQDYRRVTVRAADPMEAMRTIEGYHGEYALHNTSRRESASHLADYFRCAINRSALIWVAWTPQQQSHDGAEADHG